MSAHSTDSSAAQPERLDLTSTNLTQHLLQQLQKAAPQVFQEGKVDFTRLREALGDAIDGDNERYGLSWAGKREAFQQINTPSAATLRPQPADSVRWDATENAIIEGDNLEVLKLLQKPYHGQVKLIYIDPPYNTGNEFIYPDNFREGLTEYLRYTGQLTSAGTASSSNRDTSGRFHSTWLSMMYPRLLLARNLLREDGVIFVSIDDHEVHNLRLLMNEVFGEENFIANIVWQKRYVSNVTAKHISDMHDHLLVFAKSAGNVKFNLVERTKEQLKDYKNPDNDMRGPWRAQDLSASKEYRAGQFGIITPAGNEVFPPPGRFWRCNEKQYNEWLEAGRIWFGISGEGRPMLKAFLSEVQQGLTPNTWWSHDFAGHNKEATLETKELFDGEAPFDTSKPVRLIQRIIKLVTTPGNDLILDFFAGSGTTAQAVLESNEEDNGNRRFILVQLPEPTRRIDYPTIIHITQERVRRVVARLDKAQAGKLAFDSSRAARRGFRAFSLAQSNFKIWDPTASDSVAQLALFADNRVSGRTDDDRLWELILKAGLPLGSLLTPFDAAGQPAYSLEEGRVVLCVAAPLTREALRALLAPPTGTPQLVICLDAAFQSTDADALKTNAVLEAKAMNIRFKTT